MNFGANFIRLAFKLTFWMFCMYVQMSIVTVRNFYASISVYVYVNVHVHVICLVPWTYRTHYCTWYACRKYVCLNALSVLNELLSWMGLSFNSSVVSKLLQAGQWFHVGLIWSEFASWWILENRRLCSPCVQQTLGKRCGIHGSLLL